MNSEDFKITRGAFIRTAAGLVAGGIAYLRSGKALAETDKCEPEQKEEPTFVDDSNPEVLKSFYNNNGDNLHEKIISYYQKTGKIVTEFDENKNHFVDLRTSEQKYTGPGEGKIFDRFFYYDEATSPFLCNQDRLTTIVDVASKTLEIIQEFPLTGSKVSTKKTYNEVTPNFEKSNVLRKEVKQTAKPHSGSEIEEYDRSSINPDMPGDGDGRPKKIVATYINKAIPGDQGNEIIPYMRMEIDPVWNPNTGNLDDVPVKIFKGKSPKPTAEFSINPKTKKANSFSINTGTFRNDINYLNLDYEHIVDKIVLGYTPKTT
jgi:hypothetical protein